MERVERRCGSRSGLAAIAAALATTTALTANAGTWAGVVRNTDGDVLPGVMVRVTDDVSGISESVFTDADGAFEFVTRLDEGKLHLRLRTPYYRDLAKTFNLGNFDAIYPHTIRFDADGIAWYTLAGSEQVGNLDPATGETELVNLPRVRPGGISRGTTPYGIDIEPDTGMVWYSRLFGDKIGRIDPETLEVTEYDAPVRGPRRMRFDADGILWVTGYSDGDLARIDPDGFASTVYSMPGFAPGFRPAPYALGVHPDTGDIWINENMTDRIYRFIPDEERFVVYPVPLSGTYTRDVDFTADGKACMSNNPVPAAALEGGVLQLICFDVGKTEVSAL